MDWSPSPLVRGRSRPLCWISCSCRLTARAARPGSKTPSAAPSRPDSCLRVFGCRRRGHSHPSWVAPERPWWVPTSSSPQKDCSSPSAEPAPTWPRHLVSRRKPQRRARRSRLGATTPTSGPASPTAGRSPDVTGPHRSAACSAPRPTISSATATHAACASCASPLRRISAVPAWSAPIRSTSSSSVASRRR